jgi:hypothetical protein
MQTKTGIILPDGYDRIKVVQSLKDMFAVPMDVHTNAVVCERPALPQNFSSLDLRQIFNLNAKGQWKSNHPDLVREAARKAGNEQREALNQILRDMADITAAGKCTMADLVTVVAYEDPRIVFGTSDFHWDAYPDSEEVEIILCNYGLGADGRSETEWIRDEDAVRQPDTDDKFTAREGAQIYQFGKYHFWRMKAQHAGIQGKPFTHRAPAQPPGAPDRAFLFAMRRPGRHY